MNEISQATLRLHSEDYSAVLHSVMITLTSKCTDNHQFFRFNGSSRQTSLALRLKSTIHNGRSSSKPLLRDKLIGYVHQPRDAETSFGEFLQTTVPGLDNHQ